MFVIFSLLLCYVVAQTVPVSVADSAAMERLCCFGAICIQQISKSGNQCKLRAQAQIVLIQFQLTCETLHGDWGFQPLKDIWFLVW